MSRPSPLEELDDVTRLLTSFASFRSLVDSSYTPTIRVESFFSRRHRNAAAKLRRALHDEGRPMSPRWGTYQGESDGLAEARP